MKFIANVEEKFPLIKDQDTFDTLFNQLFSKGRLIGMRAFGHGENDKVHPQFLTGHEVENLDFIQTSPKKNLNGS